MHWRALGALAAAAWLAAGCISTPISAPSAEAVALERRARAAEESGDVASATQLYRQLANITAGNARAGYLLDGARLAAASGDRALAAAWLAEADPLANGAQRQAITVLRAELDVLAARPADALMRLEALPQSAPVPVLTDADRVRGRALFALDRPVEAVRTLVERETWLDSAAAILENQRLLWDELAAANLTDAAATGDELVDGWLALAPIAASAVSGAELRGALVDWRRRYAAHPAGGALLADLLATGSGGDAYPEQIALLLPISSPQRALALAVRDGFLAAHLAAGPRDEPMSIRVYDTAQLGAEEAYRRAQLEGAAFIVGPLLGPEVSRILPQAGLVPTLALNFTDADASLTPSFWQFALAPEDETRAIARRAFADGARTAVALVPIDASGWGMRLLNSFRAEFERLGGRVLEHETYERAARDFSSPIEALLNLDLSQQRRTRLQANLGVNLQFEARRRQDADMIFLAAPDRESARLLAPALRLYLTAEPLPVYANTDIHEPAAAARDGDLNDIYFPDAPWLLDPDPRGAELRRALQTHSPQRAAGGVLRLYGMGVDAYRLVGSLYSGGADAWPIGGLSGELELGVDGRIRRSLPFAQFRNGRPVALRPIPLETLPPANEAAERRQFFGAR